jgi:phytanoyl-CoA hydroxylase
MSHITQEEAFQKRDELVNDGFTVIPGVMSQEFVQELRVWSDDIFSRVPVDRKHRYQGSDIHVATPKRWEEMQPREETNQSFPDIMAARQLDLPAQREVCDMMGLEGHGHHESMIILSKPGNGPPLYWHQDFMDWNNPRAATPWPTQIFISYYLTDTNRENGCLRAIPGTHRKRINLHGILPAAHGEEIQSIEDLNHEIFEDHPDAVDLAVNAGDLVIADGRVLHAAWPNQTPHRRTLLLQWHAVFPFPFVPSWWEDEIPDAIRNADPTQAYEGTRIPGKHLK